MSSSCTEPAGPTEAPAPPRTWQTAVQSPRLSRWIFWGSRGSLALLDQGLVASSNFVIGILLARTLLPQQYGSYGLAFAIFLLLSLGYQALVLEPQRIFGPTDHLSYQREYLGVLLWIHSVLAIGICAALATAAWLMHGSSPSDTMPAALAGMAIAAPCILLLWLARGAFYARMLPQYAVTGSGVYCTVIFASLAVVYKLKLQSPFATFLVMAVAAVIGSSVLLLQLKPRLCFWKTHLNWRSVFQQNWKYGRWILVSSALSWISGEIYYPLVGSFSGLAAAGTLKALLNFSLPVTQALNALCVFVLPYAARANQEDGTSALASITWKMGWLFGAAAMTYWGLLICFSKPVIQCLYSARYPEVASLLPLLALGSIPWNVAYVPAIALRAVRSSSSILVAYSVSSAAAIIIGIPATKAFGLKGALWGIIISNFAALLVASLLVARKLGKIRQ